MTVLIEITDKGTLQINYRDLINWAYGNLNQEKGSLTAALRTLEGKLQSIRTDHLHDEP